MEITSTPSGASVVVDGQALGTTPATLAVEPGQHAVVVRAQDAVDEARTIDVEEPGSSLALSLWRAHPIVTYLKRGVTWSDGLPFTSQDVVFTYQMLMFTNAGVVLIFVDVTLTQSFRV